MAQQETIKINVESNAAEVTKEVEDAVKDLKQSVDSVGEATNSSLDNLGKSAKKAEGNVESASKGMKKLADSGVDAKEGVDGAVTVLDQFTGGMAGMITNVARGFMSFGKQAVKAFRAAITGASGMRKALIATGIGAIIAAVGTLIAYWEDLMSWFGWGSEATEEQTARTERLAEATEKAKEAQNEYNKAISAAQGTADASAISLGVYLEAVNDVTKAEEDRLFALDKLKEAGVITEDIDLANAESLGLLNDRVRENIELTFARAQANAAAQYLEKEMIRLYEIEAENAQRAEILKQFTDLTEGTGLEVFTEVAARQERVDAMNLEANARKNILRAQENYKKAIEELLPLEGKNAEQQEEVRKRLERRAKTDEAVAQALKDRQDAEEKYQELLRKSKEAEVAEAQSLLVEMSKALDSLYEEQLTDKERELNAVADKYYQLEQYYRDDAETMKFIEEQKQKDLNDIRERYRKEDQDKEDLNREQKKAAILQMTKDTLDAVAALSDAFAGEDEEQQRRNFNIQKALSAANVTISTIEGAQNAYTTAQKSPITPFFPAYPAIQAGLATAFGIAQLQQIRKSQFQGGGDPTAPSSAGGGAGTPMAGTTPSFNIVGGSGANVIAESLSKTPIKAYVVGSEVTTQQELDRKQIKSATL